MRNGDISNAQSGRLWFVAEGLVLLPIKGVIVAPKPKRVGMKRAAYSLLRSSYMINHICYKRMWDLAWRYDFRLAVVTFNSAFPEWVESLRDWLDEVDIPAAVHAYSYEDFVTNVVSLPSCLRVYDADINRAMSYGAKGSWIDPHYDFEPLEA